MSKRNRLAIIGGVRSPQAKAFGKLKDISAVQLGVHVATGLLDRLNVDPNAIDEVIFGNVAGPPDAANIARVIGLASKIPHDKIAHTVNRNCASGMEAIISAWHAINEGRSRIILAGGTESMSSIPLLFRTATKDKFFGVSRAKSLFGRIKAFASFRPRDFKPVMGIELGLTDPTCNLNMGQTAENIAQSFAVSRKHQDEFALKSHQNAVMAGNRCFLSGEILPLAVTGSELRIDVGPRENQSLEQLAKLRPLFAHESENGTVTAGNSCPLTDGSAAMLLASEQSALDLTSSPLGYVSHYTIAGCDPKQMGLGPVFAIAKLLGQTQMSLDDFDLFEINEAFAAQVLGCLRAIESEKFGVSELGISGALGTIPMEKLNIHGGAIALGHPVGTSGMRIVLTLARALKEKGLKRGIASLCVGGGQGVAMIVESA